MSEEKKKAEAIVESFNALIPMFGNINDTVAEAEEKIIKDHKASIECAKLHVKGIINEIDYWNTPIERKQFWSGVLTELNKM